ncbi:unnamed protein product, partial [Candidula unifasciata]
FGWREKNRILLDEAEVRVARKDENPCVESRRRVIRGVRHNSCLAVWILKLC